MAKVIGMDGKLKGKPKTPRQAQEGKPMVGSGEAIAKLDELGLDAICERIANGESLTQIAKGVGVAVGSLCSWIGNPHVPERSSRAREARVASAEVWYDKGLDYLLDENMEVSRARELALHCRKKAAVLKPSEFGEKIKVEGDGGPAAVIDALANLVTAISGTTRSLLAEDNPVIEIGSDQQVSEK